MSKNELKLFIIKLLIITLLLTLFVLGDCIPLIIVISFLYMFVQLPPDQNKRKKSIVLLEPFILVISALLIFNVNTFIKEQNDTRKVVRIEQEINEVIDKSDEQILIHDNYYENPKIKLNKNVKPGMLLVNYKNREVIFLNGYNMEKSTLSAHDSCYSAIPQFKGTLTNQGALLTLFSDTYRINKIEINMKDGTSLYCCEANIPEIDTFYTGVSGYFYSSIPHDLDIKEAFKLLSDYIDKYDSYGSEKLTAFYIYKSGNNTYDIRCVYSGNNDNVDEHNYAIGYKDNRWIIVESDGYSYDASESIKKILMNGGKLYINENDSTFKYLLEKKLKGENGIYIKLNDKNVKLLKKGDNNYYLVEYTDDNIEYQKKSYILFQLKEAEWIINRLENIDINSTELDKYNFQPIN